MFRAAANARRAHSASSASEDAKTPSVSTGFWVESESDDSLVGLFGISGFSSAA